MLDSEAGLGWLKPISPSFVADLGLGINIHFKSLECFQNTVSLKRVG